MRLQSGYKDWQSRLEAELRKDGFISGDKRKYKFEVKGKSLKINGKDVPTGLRDKYWNLYREQYGDAANNHFSLSIDDDK